MRKSRYAIRKLKVGVGSVLIGFFILGGSQQILADESQAMSTSSVTGTQADSSLAVDETYPSTEKTETNLSSVAPLNQDTIQKSSVATPTEITSSATSTAVVEDNLPSESNQSETQEATTSESKVSIPSSQSSTTPPVTSSNAQQVTETSLANRDEKTMRPSSNEASEVTVTSSSTQTQIQTSLTVDETKQVPTLTPSPGSSDETSEALSSASESAGQQSQSSTTQAVSSPTEKDGKAPETQTEKSEVEVKENYEAETKSDEARGDEVDQPQAEIDRVDIAYSQSMPMMMRAMMTRAAAGGTPISAATINTLKAINFTDQALLDTYGIQIRATDYMLPAIQLANAEGKTWASLTQAERNVYFDRAKTNLLNEKIGHDVYRETFNQVRDQIEDYLDQYGVTADSEAKIKANPHQFVLGLSYLAKLYQVVLPDGTSTLKDKLVENIAETNLVDGLINIGNKKETQLAYTQIPTFYANTIAPAFAKTTDLATFIKDSVGASHVDQWFKDQLKIYHYIDPNLENGVFERFARDNTTLSHVLPLLNLNKDTIYAIVTDASISYGLYDAYVSSSDQEAAFASKIQEVGEAQIGHMKIWSELSNQRAGYKNTVLIDTMRIKEANEDPYKKASGTSPQGQWASKFQTKGLSEFIAPFNYYAGYLNAGGVAEGDNIRLYMFRLLNEAGMSTYSHEMIHLYQNDYLQGHRSRPDFKAELFPRGLWESFENDEAIFTLNTIFANRQYANADYRQFLENNAVKANIQSYTKNLIDLVYTLEIMEAEAILDETDASSYFKQIVPRTGSDSQWTDTFQTTGVPTGLTTIDDLVDSDLVVKRYSYSARPGQTDVAQNNDYHTIPLFSSFYAALQNNHGSVGDVSLRRLAYELLAEYGYDDGMVAYLSDKHANGAPVTDQTVLAAIFGADYATMKDFKKAMYAKRKAKVADLRDVTFTYKGASYTQDDIPTLMNQAVAADKTYTGYYTSSNVEQLKRAIYSSYKALTQDYRSTIYDETTVENQVREEVIPLPAPTYIDDATKPTGFQQVENAGQAGVKEITYKITKVNGQVVSEEKISETIKTAAIAPVIRRGTGVVGQDVQSQEVEIPLPSATYIDDPSLAAGTEVVDNPGSVGRKKITSTTPTLNGVATGTPVVTEEILTPAVAPVIRRGTGVVGQDVQSQEVDIPMPAATYIDDPSLAAGTEVVESTGSVGRKKITTTTPTLNGVATGTPVVTEEILTPAVAPVIRRGTGVVGQDVQSQEVDIPLPAATYIDDPSLAAGTEVVDNPGSVGRKKITSTTPTLNGVATGSPVVTEEILTPAVAPVIRRGTGVVGQDVQSQEVEIPLPSATYIDDPSLAAGTEVVDNPGSVGRKKITSTTPTLNGVATGTPVVTEEILTPAVAPVIRRGTGVVGQDVQSQETDIPLPSATYIDDPSLAAGTEVVESTGSVGRKKITSTTPTLNGVATGTPVVTEEILTPAVAPVIRRGTGVVGQNVQSQEADIPLPAATYIDDPSLAAGTEVVDNPGSVGRKKITTTTPTLNGVATGSPVVTEEILTPAVAPVIRRGTGVVGQDVQSQEVDIPLPAATYIDDPSLAAGTEVVESAGSVGRKKITTTTPTFNGVATGTPVVTEEILTPAVAPVIRRGTGGVGQEVQSQEVDIPIPAATYIDDPSLAAGTEVVDNPGSVGRKKITTTTPTLNGIASGTPVVTEEILTPAVAPVIRRGIGVVEQDVQTEEDEVIEHVRQNKPRFSAKDVNQSLPRQKLQAENTSSLPSQTLTKPISSKNVNPQTLPRTGESFLLSSWLNLVGAAFFSGAVKVLKKRK